MAVSAEALVRQLSETYTIHCRRARAEIEWASTVQEVLAALARPVKPTLLQDMPLMHQERLMWTDAGERIEILHARSIAFLASVPVAEFESLLEWHRLANLEPCKAHFPSMYQNFEARLRRLADERRVRDLRQGAPLVLH